MSHVLREEFGHELEPALPEILKQVSWKTLRGGEELFREGDSGSTMFFVLSGRLIASVENPDGSKSIVGEIGRGEAVGEMAVLSDWTRGATVQAVRDTMLAELSAKALRTLGENYPHIIFGLSRLVVERLNKVNRHEFDTFNKISSIAVYPISEKVSTLTFVCALKEALSRFGNVAVVTINDVPQRFLNSDLSDSVRSEFSARLEQQEFNHRFVLYLADPENSDWCNRCIRQADRVLLIADAQEKIIAAERVRTTLSEHFVTEELVILHQHKSNNSASTTALLSAYQPARHHHIDTSNKDDYARLARFMHGSAVGLVLAGGGARGFAHIGILKALREFQIPVDAVGGTSIGALMAASVAQETSPDFLHEQSRRAFVEEKPLNDFTVPLTALVRGNKLNLMLKQYYGSGNIEDCWLRYFCLSGNLTREEIKIHRSGVLWRALRASVSLPGMLPPLVEQGDLLVDGGLIDNFPVGVMRNQGVGLIIGSNIVTRQQDKLAQAESGTTSWENIKSKLTNDNPQTDIPGIATILLRSALLGSAKATADNIKLTDLYFCPEVSHIGLIDFKAIDEVVDVGYQHACERLMSLTAEELGQFQT